MKETGSITLAVVRNGQPGAKGDKGDTGDAGISVVNVVPEYCLSDSPTTITGEGTGYSWSETRPTVNLGQYIWTRTKTTLTGGDPNPVYSRGTCDTTISGLLLDVNANTNSIRSKVWGSDISAAIASYDNGTDANHVVMRNRMTSIDQTMDGIVTAISDDETSTITLPDGTTITTIASRMHTVEETADRHTSMFENMTVGARNLMQRTRDYDGWFLYSGVTLSQDDEEDVMVADFPSVSSASWRDIAIRKSDGLAPIKYSMVRNREVTLTFWVKIDDTSVGVDNACAPTFGLCSADSTTRKRYSATSRFNGTLQDTTDWQKFVGKLTITDDIFVNGSGEIVPETDRIYIQFFNHSTTSTHIKKIKLEYGNIPTEWTPAPEDENSAISSVRSIAEQTADHFYWLVENGATSSSLTLTNAMLSAVTNQFVIKAPGSSSTTIISGGRILTNTITTDMLATDAIKSTNYVPLQNSHFSSEGAFLDLSDGSLYMPNFAVDGDTGEAYFNGTVMASAGRFGTDNAYLNIETIYDYDGNAHPAIVSQGDIYIQTGNWQVSNNAVATRHYTKPASSAGELSYYKDDTTQTYYDVGMKIPTDFSGYDEDDNKAARFRKVFFYGRKYYDQSDEGAPSSDDQWTYFFMVDTDGNLYEKGVPLSEKYAGIGDTANYLRTTGGTISGNLQVDGQLSLGTNGSFTLPYSISVNGHSFNNTANVNVGTIGVAYGGTGQTTAQAAANAFINALAAGSETNVPVDNDYFISQYISGGTTTTTYYRRRFSLIWDYINGKIQSTYDIPNTYRELTNNSFDTADITEAEIGDLLVTGSGRFSNGLYGNLTGNVTGNLTGTASRATADADGNTIPDTYVKKAGDTLTGNLQYTMYGSTRTPLNIYGGASSGQGIAIGAGGAVIVGSGESAMLAVNNQSLNATTEILWLMSDNAIRFYTNCNTYANKVSAILSNSLQFYPETGNTGSIGTSDDPWATVYATNLHGALTGNASTATALATGVNIQVGNKTVNNWTGTSNLSFAMNDIAPMASASSAGWMSSTDYGKLAAITVTEGGGIEVGTIQGDRGITVTTDTSGSTTITTVAHTQSAISADWASGTDSTTNLAFGATVTLPKIHYDAYGHITEKGTTSFKLPAAPTTITGNAGSATAFSSARTIALTGETIGSASSTGASGWSITTQNLGINAVKEDKTVANASSRATTINNNFHDGVLRYFIAGSSTQGRPLADARVLHMAWDQTGYDCQIALINKSRSPLLKVRGSNNNGEYGDWIDVLGANNYTDYTVTKDGTGATGTWGISISGSANSAVFDGNGNTIATTYATKADPTFTGVLTAEAVKASSYVAVNSTGSGTVGGLALDGLNPEVYGILMRYTSNQGTHGYVTGNWATYFTMNGSETTAPPRGWIFKNAQSGSGVASINCEGNMVLNGSITVGGNSTNTSGCRMVYDDTAKCLNFVFA